MSAAGVSGFSLMGATVDPSVTVFMALPGFFGTTVVLSVSGVTGPVLAIVAAITMSATGVAGVMCAAEVSEVTLFQVSPVSRMLLLSWVLFLPWVSFLHLVSQVRLVSHLPLFSWVPLVSGATPVVDAAAVSLDALVLKSTVFLGPSFALGAALPQMTQVQLVSLFPLVSWVLSLGRVSGVSIVSLVLLFHGCRCCLRCPYCSGFAAFAVRVMGAAGI